MSRINEKTCLIIGGTTKAATSSLFKYLADHPDVCAANVKETRFFLDASYPLPVAFRYEDGPEKYEAFFSACDPSQTMRLEATPDYLYSSGTPLRVQQHLPDVRWVFILREPVSRLISWYRFARQDGLLGEESFEAYVAQQRSAPKDVIQPQHLRALEQGRYAHYLAPYFKRFGSDKVQVVFYEDLASEPAVVMRNLCARNGIDTSYYDEYAFKVHNATNTMRNPGIHNRYKQMQFQLRRWTIERPAVRAVLRTGNRLIKPFYMQLNARKKSNEVDVSQPLRQELNAYYDQDIAMLEQMIGGPTPWNREDVGIKVVKN